MEPPYRSRLAYANRKPPITSRASTAGNRTSPLAQAHHKASTPIVMRILAATQADRLLRDRRLSVAQVAEQRGYATETSFRQAFKRIRGVGPGKVRRRGPNLPLRAVARPGSAQLR